jgi:threonine dehydrogenase-like Zn-dependent dehydrogenase
VKAVVFHGEGDVRVDDVPEPTIQNPTDAIVRLIATSICGTDVHIVRGSLPGMRPGTILGHEGVGIVEQFGDDVRDLEVDDRVVIASTIACGSCSYCREGEFAQCDRANPNGALAGTSYYGGPEQTGPYDGLQAEKARIPFANVGLFKLPDEVNDEQALLMSDIFPTGWFGADIADIEPGDTVAVFGCGPVGQFAVMAAIHMAAGRVLAVDRVPDRLDMARRQGAETIDFSREDPVQTLRRLTGGIGPDRVIDAVGVDAEGGEAQALEWAADAVAKAGTLSIIGVYPPQMERFPIGKAMNKNLSLRMGNCNHRKYIPHLVDLVSAGVVDPTALVTELEAITDAQEAYREFEEHHPGWLKVEILPVAG